MTPSCSSSSSTKASSDADRISVCGGLPRSRARPPGNFERGMLFQDDLHHVPRRQRTQSGVAEKTGVEFDNRQGIRDG